jgi:uncharacterized membrane protein
METDPTRVFVTLALASAAFYGAADFLGGIAAKRADSVVVTFVAQAAGLGLLALLLPVLPSSSPVPGDYGWGAAAGVAGSLGVAFLYRALAIGTMSIVAPITAVCAAAVPVLVAVALGERPAVPAGVGIVLAAIAIVLLSRVEHARAVEIAPRRTQSAGGVRNRRGRVDRQCLATARTSSTPGTTAPSLRGPWLCCRRLPAAS